jgi:hypothetical protein
MRYVRKLLAGKMTVAEWVHVSSTGRMDVKLRVHRPRVIARRMADDLQAEDGKESLVHEEGGDDTSGEESDFEEEDDDDDDDDVNDADGVVGEPDVLLSPSILNDEDVIAAATS